MRFLLTTGRCFAFITRGAGCVMMAMIASAHPAIAQQQTSQQQPQAQTQPQQVPPIRLAMDRFGGGKATCQRVDRFPCLSADFEPTRALVLSLGDWLPRHRKMLAQIAGKTAGHVNVLVLCRDNKQMRTATEWLLECRECYEQSQGYPNIYFCKIQSDTVWVRDFGPLFARTRGGKARVLDFFYEGTRPLDDRLPKLWCDRSQCEYVRVPWTIQGGNLISNGDGVALTTQRIFVDNRITFPSHHPQQNPEYEARKIVVDAITRACNLSQLVILESLKDELTRHVDIFACFLSPTDVLVARLDPQKDPVNAKILERNVIRLSRVIVDGKPLTVHRIDIPPRVGTSWSAYNNALIAGDLVLMPTYQRDPPELVGRAIETFKRLLPEHHVETLDVSEMEKLQGELHCVTLHAPEYASVPTPIYSFANAIKAYFPEFDKSDR